MSISHITQVSQAPTPVTTPLPTSVVPTDAALREQVHERYVRMWHEWLDTLVASREVSQATATTYRIGLRKLIEYAQAEGISRDLIARWKADLAQNGCSPASVNTWLAGVKHFFAWACERGYMAANPARDVKSARRTGTTKRHKRDALTNEEAVRLLDLPLPCRSKAIIALKLYCGLRDIELQRADVEDLRSEGGELVLAVQGKGALEKDRIVVLAHPEVKEAMREWLAERGARPGPLFVSMSKRSLGARLSMPALRALIKEALELAGVKRPSVTGHSLRHTAITAVLEGGGSLLQAQAVAGHANPATTGIYVHNRARIADAGERKIEYRRR